MGVLGVLCVLGILGSVVPGGTSATAYDSVNKDLLLKKVERKIDVAAQVVKITSKISLENAGSGAVGAFLLALTEGEKQNLAFLNAQSGGTTLKLSESKVHEHQDIEFFKVELKDALQPGKIVNVEVECYLTHMLEAYPAVIQQGEKQLVRYLGNHYILTPYTTTTQTTTVTLPSPNVESYSRLKPSSHTDTSITYGPYDGVKPFSHDAMVIHYENNSPFLTVTNLERVIELSHWGNIAVEETIDVLHTGAKLKGSFSRYDFQREHNTYSSVKSFKTIIPASAKDVYYRDEIGNISTSHMRIQDDAVELDLRPRFPLFGGWKTHYKIGYNVPSYEYLYNSGDEFILKMRILDHVYDDVIVDNLIVKVVLPEGVRNIELETPYPVERKADTLHYTYLDTIGRPVITISKKNLVESHIQDFSLKYSFPSILMLQEPLLVVVAFFILFITVILYVRLDLTLSKDDAIEAKMRVSSHCEMIDSHHDKRARQYEKLEEELQKLKVSKDVNQFQTATKKILQSIRDETQIISDLGAKIRLDNAEYADKVVELQKAEKALRDSMTQQLTNVEKLVLGKMTKQQYMDAETPLHKKKEEQLEKMKTILSGI
ncbi:dolichyl-diphosphooligosaccharide--protein glycosyltransferase subunit 1-like [Penaeus chinensis]|uniref:dolichyl-diphosphooligosaccharide--protein glycosyltransferase subunit 1-like n=1 Tax=Penaeus chinensis TaxID=139456 RepID=UPI001FB6A25E|nr:dolichyl-diphosphooligosaccharide--protein glycosyltransferase subunit 1-like [Penaeus chinensis]